MNIDYTGLNVYLAVRLIKPKYDCIYDFLIDLESNGTGVK